MEWYRNDKAAVAEALKQGERPDLATTMVGGPLHRGRGRSPFLPIPRTGFPDLSVNLDPGGEVKIAPSMIY